MQNMGYQAVRTPQWKYIRYTDLENMDELYDLNADPYELQNLIDRPEHRAKLSQLRQELTALVKATP
jgi:N-acetylglucosamine-6-sulfatase